MLDGVLDLIPSAKVSVVGIARNHETLAPEPYFERFVGQLDSPHGADRRSDAGHRRLADHTVDMLKRNGCKQVRALVMVATPEGIKAMQEAHPDVDIYTAAIDSHLNEIGYIMPGLGDAGDRFRNQINGGKSLRALFLTSIYDKESHEYKP